jgi:vitamin B12 transporter
MKKKTLLALLILPVLARAAEPEGEEEGVFLSLTRTQAALDELPAQRTVVTRADLERSGAKNLADALESVPGAVFNRTGTVGSLASLRLRGVPTSNQVLILIDDQPLSGVAVQNVDLSQIPVGNIERIEVVRGGASVLYGANAIGGVVNVITRRPAPGPVKTRLTTEWGSFFTQTYRGEIGKATDRQSVYVSAGRDLSEGFQDNADSDGIHVTGRAGRRGARGGVVLSVARIDNETGAPDGTPVPLGEWNGERERAANDPDTRVAQKITRARLSGDWALGEWGTLLPAAFVSGHAYENFGGLFPSDHFERTAGGELRLRTVTGFALGGGYERDARAGAGETPTHVTNWSLFAQQEWKAGPLSLSPAVRFDQHSDFGNIYNPRLTAVYRATERWRLSASAARSFRAPTFLDLVYPGFSNPQLRPEVSWSYDAGLEWGGPAGRYARATGYFAKITDRIVADFTTGFVPYNRPRSELSGAEVEAGARWGFLRTRASYAYSRSVGNSTTSSNYRPTRLAPRHVATQEVLMESRSGWAWRNAVRYVHKQFSGDGETGSKLPSFTVWNMGLTKRILAARAWVSADNLTDKHYAESVGFAGFNPQPGRTFRAGVTIEFQD